MKLQICFRLLMSSRLVISLNSQVDCRSFVLSRSSYMLASPQRDSRPLDNLALSQACFTIEMCHTLSSQAPARERESIQHTQAQQGDFNNIFCAPTRVQLSSLVDIVVVVGCGDLNKLSLKIWTSISIGSSWNWGKRPESWELRRTNDLKNGKTIKGNLISTLT